MKYVLVGIVGVLTYLGVFFGIVKLTPNNPTLRIIIGVIVVALSIRFGLSHT